MSVQRTGLSSKPIVAAVLVLLAVVVVVNVLVFKPGARKGPARTEVRVQSSAPLPADLGLVQAAGPAGADLAAWPDNDAPRLRRDPFGTRRPAAKISTSVEEDPAPEPKGPAPLECNAVLLGGLAPTALINGVGYRVGDDVRGHEVAAIGTAGVKIVAADGTVRWLPIRPAGTGGPSHVVSDRNTQGTSGRTSLVEHAQSERN